MEIFTCSNEPILQLLQEKQTHVPGRHLGGLEAIAPLAHGLSPPGYWRGFYVEDLYIFECTNVDDMLFMLTEGMRHRAVGSHHLNKDSSRSHSMLTFYLESEEEVDSDPYVKFGKISFVDLAGSERLKETQVADEYGGRSDFQATFRSRARMKGDEMLKETGARSYTARALEARADCCCPHREHQQIAVHAGQGHLGAG